ncbi:MAK16 protein, putative [Eimeria necatrix]|uniref:Protein MAK16 homolog n=1 Tax=Eimeria necatrix TaxID=51315 RepID=U6N139_9EIME|nr:MAK16 protein, putative [Eimeria necatrix]CDJ70178.1 MAK16 protein, putative [Eimeria necatrix]
MQNDELIWSVVNKHFCAFKKKTDKEDMCRNLHNVTGKCNRVSCPLANSLYATVLEQQGKLYLYLKTAERAHLPSRLWEKLKLPRSLKEAKHFVRIRMQNEYPKHQIQRCLRRLIRLRQMLDRMRRLELKPREKLEGVKKKTERREAAREKKALRAAHIEDVIEDELLKRLHQGVYGNLYEEHRMPAEAEQQQEDPEVTEEKAAEAGSIRFEAAAEAEEEPQPSASDLGSDSDLESEDFSFSDLDLESDLEGEKGEKEAEEEESEVENEVSLEDIQPVVESSKKRRASLQKAEDRPPVPVATLRRQAAKRRNTRVRIEYEPEAMAEEM